MLDASLPLDMIVCPYKKSIGSACALFCSRPEIKLVGVGLGLLAVIWRQLNSQLPARLVAQKYIGCRICCLEFPVELQAMGNETTEGTVVLLRYICPESQLEWGFYRLI
jgi:hypothetical protein